MAMDNDLFKISDDEVLFDTKYAPGGIMLYYADGDEEIFHVNRHVLELVECDTIEEFMELTGGTFRGFVHEDDIETVEESIWSQVEEKGGMDHVFYRTRTRSGKLINIDDYGRLIETPGERPVFCVFLAIIERQDIRDWLTGLPELAHFKHIADVRTQGISSATADSASTANTPSTGGANASASASKGTPTILAFDLMGMKTYNSKYGRSGGDVLLRTFADVLRVHFDGEACCRHAGDRFFVFTDEDGVHDKIDAVFADFAEADVEGVPPVMAGACAFCPGDDVSTVLDRARFACDADNTTWESHVTWFNDDMRKEAEMRSYVLEHLDEAIENRWLRPFYQAIVRSSTGVVCSEEALARWVDPQYGILSPALLIPVLERAGLLQKLDLHMVDCILEDFATKRANGTPIVPVSVNISLRDLVRVDVAHEIATRADAAGIPHELLKIEFTESAASEDPELLRTQVKALHDVGFEVWMDDFGSGYSSLNSLGQFKFDVIKLDMDMIRNIHNERARSVIAGTIKIAEQMGLNTLAEGVETAEQAAILESIGCNMLQGYHFAKPQPLDAICQDVASGTGGKREKLSEHAYWNTIGLFDLDRPISRDESWAADGTWLRNLPAAIAERRGNNWQMVRLNKEYREFLALSQEDHRPPTSEELHVTTDEIDGDFLIAVQKCLKSGKWERIAGRLEYGTGLQFYTKLLAAAEGAQSFAIASIPTMLGTTLGSYGDVPVAYAVFRAVMDDEGEEIVDAEFVFANNEYCEPLGLVQTDMPGRSFLDTVGDVGVPWLDYIYRAAMLNEKIHEIHYGPAIKHWISFNVAPAAVENCCTFAYTNADDESRERERMIVGLTTSDFIIDIIDKFNSEPDYDAAMNKLLQAISTIVHPERLYIFERKGDVTDNTFEWCAPGIEPEIDTLQNLDNSEFDTWVKLLTEEPIVMIPDVEALIGIDDRMYWQLSRQGITHMLAVPLNFGDELLGYIGADNYVLEEDFDTQRLLKSIAGTISARIMTQRLIDSLR